eukprot:CAMPEP_0168387850 /NCGR_PEP_ID=MMETSP0228-20121227/16155_1 /TAXON_ID=133427 /ORGANISM="Protoceratium reticulatum, Strain CCCM 535 (=CCMP 1889)" /LENGTH=42 /DNA_ID= /DNA_START= /DNA_END= /DNA_ORIENTATION=
MSLKRSKSVMFALVSFALSFLAHGVAAHLDMISSFSSASLSV